MRRRTLGRKLELAALNLHRDRSMTMAQAARGLACFSTTLVDYA
jgi:hypothetical protein